MPKIMGCFWLAWSCLWLWGAVFAYAETKVVTESSTLTTHFQFESIQPPALDDAGSRGELTVVAGRVDNNSANPRCLIDGKIPETEDHPQANFFFAPGTSGGRLIVDLKNTISIREVVTYSWHSGTRSAQVYTLYGATGDERELVVQELKSLDPRHHGWKRIAAIDSRRPERGAGQHAAKVDDSTGTLGRYRYLLFDFSPTETLDPFGNTFYSEIDVVDAEAPKPQRIAIPETKQLRFASEDGHYQFLIDCTQAPELTEWSETKLKPVVQSWYPKIVNLLPSEGYQPPTEVTFRYRPADAMRGVPAYAQGNAISMNAPWMRAERDREAIGAVVHEMVHVVQAYQRNPRNRGRRGPPGWIVEGIPDYVRWFLYEPQTLGAALSPRALASAKHDASYRVSANFIDWVIRNHDKDLLPKLNAAAREGRYEPALWQQWTGKSESELAAAWRSQKQP